MAVVADKKDVPERVADGAHDEWLRVPEVAGRFKVSARTIWRAIHDGHLRSYRPTGTTRVVLVKATDVVAWLAGGVTDDGGDT